MGIGQRQRTSHGLVTTCLSISPAAPAPQRRPTSRSSPVPARGPSRPAPSGFRSRCLTAAQAVDRGGVERRGASEWEVPVAEVVPGLRRCFKPRRVIPPALSLSPLGERVALRSPRMTRAVILAGLAESVPSGTTPLGPSRLRAASSLRVLARGGPHRPRQAALRAAVDSRVALLVGTATRRALVSMARLLLVAAEVAPVAVVLTTRTPPRMPGSRAARHGGTTTTRTPSAVEALAGAAITAWRLVAREPRLQGSSVFPAVAVVVAAGPRRTRVDSVLLASMVAEAAVVAAPPTGKTPARAATAATASSS